MRRPAFAITLALLGAAACRKPEKVSPEPELVSKADAELPEADAPKEQKPPRVLRDDKGDPSRRAKVLASVTGAIALFADKTDVYARTGASPYDVFAIPIAGGATRKVLAAVDAEWHVVPGLLHRAEDTGHGRDLFVKRFGGTERKIASTNCSSGTSFYDDKALYWLCHGSVGAGPPMDGRIWRVERPTLAARTIVTGLTLPNVGTDWSPGGAISDGAMIFWPEREPLAVFSLPVTGGTKKVVNSKEMASPLSANATTLTLRSWDGRLLRVPRTGGSAVEIPLDAADAPQAIRGDASGLYFTTEDSAVLQLVEGAPPAVLALGKHEIRSITTNDTHVFWADGDDIVGLMK